MNITVNTHVYKHNFNYATSVGLENSEINKLELRNEEDLIDYIKDLLKNTIDGVKINKDIISIANLPTTKLEITILED